VSLSEVRLGRGRGQRDVSLCRVARQQHICKILNPFWGWPIGAYGARWALMFFSNVFMRIGLRFDEILHILFYHLAIMLGQSFKFYEIGILSWLFFFEVALLSA
jgi:hypothetical protein